MPPNEVRADPVEITRLADQMLTSSQQVADVWRPMHGALAIPVAAFGDSGGAAGVHTAHDATFNDADVAIGRLGAVIEGDMDRLYRIAFAYKKADDDAARKVQQQHRNIPL